MKDTVWLLGAGGMAQDYYKVLRALISESGITVIGRGRESARKFQETTGAVRVVTGGLKAYLDSQPAHLPDLAIVSVGMPELASTAQLLIEAGCKNILLEKPGGVDLIEINALADFAGKHESKVVVAYNRRFYESVRIARKMIREDGGPSSFSFEFTEWSHVISTLQKPKVVFASWLLANSSHVIDMAFHLGGSPASLSCFTGGRGQLAWHEQAAIFTGAGVTTAGVPFSYQANWLAPGRWGVEVMTSRHRYIFRPLEKLQIQKIGSVATEEIVLDDHLDKEFKPGLYRQVLSCLEKKYENFATLEDQRAMAAWCKKIAWGMGS